MNTITMSYNLKAETVGKIVKLQPSVGEFGIIAYVKREQDELKFVKGMQPLIINSYGAQNISDHQKLDNLIYLASEKEKASLTQMPQLQQQQQKLSQLKHKTYAMVVVGVRVVMLHVWEVMVVMIVMAVIAWWLVLFNEKRIAANSNHEFGGRFRVTVNWRRPAVVKTYFENTF